MTDAQIENVARWLRRTNCEWARSTGRDLDDWDAISDEKRDGYRYVARALAPALELPKADHCKMFESEGESREWYEIIPSDWLAHVAAVKAITGEEKDA